MQTYFEGDQISLFDQDTCWGNVMGVFSLCTPHGEDFRLSWSQLLDYIAPPYQFLDLPLGLETCWGNSNGRCVQPCNGGGFLRNTTLAQTP